MTEKRRVRPRSLNVTALFAGVGGFERGLERQGHRTTLLCERDPDALAVLRARFPGRVFVESVAYHDELVASVDPRSNLLAAGFPCADLSQVGTTKGFAGEQSRLVLNALRLIKSRPFAHVLLENVPNWRFLHGGAYLDTVLRSLERRGYRWAYRTIDSRAFGVPQRRQRIFLYATTEGDPRDVLFGGEASPTVRSYGIHEAAHGFYWTEGNRGVGWGENCIPTLKGGSRLGIPSAPAILMTDGRIITPDIRDAERLQGFPVNWTNEHLVREGKRVRPFNQRKRWLMVGNAVNVKVAEWLGMRLARPFPYQGPTGPELDKGDRFPAAAYGDGKKRYASDIGTWPVERQAPDLEQFLRFDGTPLSHRATLGFYTRAKESPLTFAKGFLPAVSRHLKAMAP